MKTTFLALIISVFVMRAVAGEFARSSTFESVDSFVTAASKFLPRTTKSDLSPLFTVRIRENPPNPPVTATGIQSSSLLWSGESSALVFVTAIPPTDDEIGMPSAVGILFLLSRHKTKWHIADLKRFTAVGKYAGVSAELTTGDDWENPVRHPIITIKETQGGRGYSYELSASYHFNGSTIKRLKLE